MDTLHITVGPKNADIIGNDNRALQAAVDYIATLGGGTVEILSGAYLMRNALHLRSHVTVRGQGAETILKKADAIESPLSLDGDFGEEQVTLKNPDGFAPGYGISITDDYVHIRGAVILGGMAPVPGMSLAMIAIAAPPFGTSPVPGVSIGL